MTFSEKVLLRPLLALPGRGDARGRVGSSPNCGARRVTRLAETLVHLLLLHLLLLLVQLPVENDRRGGPVPASLAADRVRAPVRRLQVLRQLLQPHHRAAADQQELHLRDRRGRDLSTNRVWNRIFKRGGTSCGGISADQAGNAGDLPLRLPILLLLLFITRASSDPNATLDLWTTILHITRRSVSTSLSLGHSRGE